MFAHLRGTLLHSELEWVILDVAGVGYEVHVPLGTQGRLGQVGDEIELWIHTSVREDAIQLYGFSTFEDRRLFQKLINVNGVGPRTGLAAIGELRPEEIVRAVHSEDIATFTRISGVGKKTAQRLILELKSTLKDFAVLPSGSPTASTTAFGDLRSALVNLGYSQNSVDQILSDFFAQGLQEEPLEELIRRALKILR